MRSSDLSEKQQHQSMSSGYIPVSSFHVFIWTSLSNVICWFYVRHLSRYHGVVRGSRPQLSVPNGKNKESCRVIYCSVVRLMNKEKFHPVGSSSGKHSSTAVVSTQYTGW
ncbi:hypothetical protein DPEC_G00108530 [Dallia pectoralis]|uniref:Uncharacterized protein n=1 Tax=Dallia pectoralis TaxID=75939 RepID=A0ACC2GSW4_DALPE|nr:hypothetical protein DPEC_G00108530 [Dallia pectoralis]